MSEQPEALKMADLNANCALAWTEGSEPYQFRMDTAALIRRQHARIEADESLMRKILQALETGHDCSIEVANDVHEKYKGYKPQRHAAVDMDVSQIDAAITAIRSRLETK